MFSAITGTVSHYYNKAKASVSSFTERHPNLTKTAVLAATTLSAFALARYMDTQTRAPTGELKCDEPVEMNVVKACDPQEKCCAIEGKSEPRCLFYDEEPINNQTIPTHLEVYDEKILSQDKECVEISQIEQFVSSLKEISSKTSSAAKTVAALATACGLGKVVTKFSEAVLSKEQINNPWLKGILGAAHYPMAILAGQVSVLTGALLDFVKPEVIKTVASQSMSSLQALIMLYPFNAGIATEEFLCRTVFQEGILKKGISAVLQKISPCLSEKYLNHTVSKTARIALSSLLFSLMHLSNLSVYSKDMVMYQLVNTFGIGLVLGYLQEKTGDTWASVGLHAAYNTLQVFRSVGTEAPLPS